MIKYKILFLSKRTELNYKNNFTNYLIISILMYFFYKKKYPTTYLKIFYNNNFKFQSIYFKNILHETSSYCNH